jgi:hypothetical protein
MPQQLFIPALGTIIILAEDWTFKLFFEGRNHTLLKALCPNKPKPLPAGTDPKSWQAKYHSKWFGHMPEDHEGSDLLRSLAPMDESELEDAHPTYRSTSSKREPYLEVTMPAKTQLKFDRIYIRAGVTAYNSVTFRTTKIGPDKRFHSKRFWVKLQDANNIQCLVVG